MRSRSRLRRAPRRARHAHRLHPSHQPRRLQGRRAGKRLENVEGRVRGHLRRRLSPRTRFSSPHYSLFHESRWRRQDRHGANTLDVSQQRLLAADQRGNDSSRRPLRRRARRAFPPRHFLQFQRHRRRVAPQSHRRCRRLATRHPHRGHRSLVSFAAQRLEISLSPANRVRFRASRGHERLQSAPSFTLPATSATRL